MKEPKPVARGVSARDLIADGAPRRMRLMPLIIIVTAAALTIWAAQRQGGGNSGNNSSSAVVQADVQRLCDDIAAGRNVDGRINPRDPLLEMQLIEAIRGAGRAAGATGAISVIVSEGDVEPVGAAAGAARATHTAMLRIGQADALGLRIEGREGQAVRVLGFWRAVPEPASRPR